MFQKIWQNKFWVLLIVAIGVRFYGSFLPGQYYDIGTYHAWGNIMRDLGPGEFFQHTWSDYLPLPIYFVSLISFLSDKLSLSFELLFKLSVGAIEFSLLLALLRFSSSKKRKWLIPLLFLSPALIGDSSFWGQLDTIPSLLTVLALVVMRTYLKNKRLLELLSVALLFSLAISFKPIMLITLPVFAILFLTNKPNFFHLLLGSLTALFIFVATALPVDHTLVGAFNFLFEKASEQASTYPHMTINAWNAWQINNPTLTWSPDSRIVLGFSAHSWGLYMFSMLALFVLNSWRKQKFNYKYSFRVAATLLIAFFTFTTRMHERHLLFGLPFLAVAILNEPWIIFPYILYSIFFVLNLWSAYYWVNNNQRWPVSLSTIELVSWGNALLTISLSLVWNWQASFKKAITWIKRNKLLLMVLVLASTLRITALAHPDTYIFDEVYHAFTSREYLHDHVEAWEWWTHPPEGVAYEWTHPPVAKYGMVLGMLLFGENSFGWRIGSAVFGVLSILGIYYLTHALTKNKKTALLASFLVSISGLHLSQSRIAMNDIYMLNFYIWSLYLAVKSKWKLSAVLYGLALGSKWSALYGIVPLAFIYLHSNGLPRSLRSTTYYLLSSIRLIAIAIAVYTLSFTPFILAGHTWDQFIELHRQMWYYHTHLVATHSYQSLPWQWVLSLRPVWYYVKYGVKIENIYVQGNPIILWLGLVALIMGVRKIFRYPYFVLYTLYFILIVPWLFSPRIMFFYHYLPSAVFLCIILATWLTSLSKKTIFYILVLCSLSFIFLFPVYYGYPMPTHYWDTLFTLFPSWR